jgi:deazaflavin-dependent oxidoreductase (nitroreductase family)
VPLPKTLARFNRVVTNPLLRPMTGRLPGFATVTHVGRRSGRVYRTPVNLFRDRERWVIPLTYGADSQWVRNVIAGAGCDVQTRGKRVHLVAPRVVHDPHGTLVPRPVARILRLARVSDFMCLESAS